MFKMVLQDFRAEFSHNIKEEKKKFMVVHNDYLLL